MLFSERHHKRAGGTQPRVGRVRRERAVARRREARGAGGGGAAPAAAEDARRRVPGAAGRGPLDRQV